MYSFKKPLSEYGKRVKIALMEQNRKQDWLISEIKNRYGSAYFDDVDGNVIEKEEFDKGDDDFDDCYDDDFDDDYYNGDKEFFDNEVLEKERLIDEAMKGGGKQ